MAARLRLGQLAPLATKSRHKGKLRLVLVTGIGAYLLMLGLVLWAMFKPPHPQQAPRLDAAQQLSASPTGQLRLALSGTGLGPQTRVALALDTGGREAIIAHLPTFGRASDLLLADGYAMLANGYRGLQCIDFSDPRHPQIAGTLNLSGKPWALSRFGTTLLVAAMKGGVHLVDIGDPTRPALLNTIVTPGPAISVTVANGLAYVLTTDRSLTLYDIRNPRQPRLISRLTLPTRPSQGVLDGNQLLLSCGQGGLQVVDVSDRHHPRLGKNLPLPGMATDIALAGRFGYIAAGLGGMLVVDLSDPASPQLVASLPTPGSCHRVTIRENRAYLADGTSGLQIVDIARPLHPQLRLSVDSPGSCTAVLLEGKFALLADEVNGLDIVDLARLSPPAPFPLLNSPDPLTKIAISGPLALLLSHQRELLVMDIGQGGRPQPLGHLAMPALPCDLAVRDRLVYVATASGVQIVDIGNPRHPQFAGHIVTTSFTTAVAVRQNMLLVADQAKNLFLFDLDDLRQPQLQGQVSLPEAVEGMVISGTTAFLACGQSGLLVVGLGAPKHPVVLGQLQPPWPQRELMSNQAERVYVQGTIAYIAHRREGLKVVDVSNPKKPRLIAQRGGMADAFDLASDGRLLYVADLSAETIHVFDIGQPKQPREIATLETPDRVQEVACADNRIYALSGRGGVFVLPEPAVGRILQSAADRSLTVELPPPTLEGNYTLRVSNEAGYDQLRDILTLDRSGLKIGQAAAQKEYSAPAQN